MLQPIKRITITVDYWSTKIKNVIIGATVSPDLTSPNITPTTVSITTPGITAVRGVADPQNLAALPLLGFAVGSYKNADTFLAGASTSRSSAKFDITNGIQWQHQRQRVVAAPSAADLTVVWSIATTTRSARVTSRRARVRRNGAAAGRTRWTSATTASVSLTGYYTAGYSSVATDSGGVYGDCAGQRAATASSDLSAERRSDPVQVEVGVQP